LLEDVSAITSSARTQKTGAESDEKCEKSKLEYYSTDEYKVLREPGLAACDARDVTMYGVCVTRQRDAVRCFRSKERVEDLSRNAEGFTDEVRKSTGGDAICGKSKMSDVELEFG
jgi:hypothetical protein